MISDKNKVDNEIIEEIELTEEENKAQLRTHEKDILKGLLTAASYKEKESGQPIEIARDGVVLFSFRIRPLSEEEYDRCREKYTTYVRNKQLGIKFPEKTNTVKYRSELIYQATVEEDREKTWNNKEAWRELNVLTGVDLIDKVLYAGEKDAVLEKLDEISGYTSIEEVAKNL